jgi:hypothetical protein
LRSRWLLCDKRDGVLGDVLVTSISWTMLAARQIDLRRNGPRQGSSASHGAAAILCAPAKERRRSTLVRGAHPIYRFIYVAPLCRGWLASDSGDARKRAATRKKAGRPWRAYTRDVAVEHKRAN